MGVKQAILKRRSVRNYRQEPVPESILKEVIEAARLAPSGFNSQPWKFYAVVSDEAKQELRKANAFKQDFVYNAPVIVVCCADPKQLEGRGIEDPEEEAKINLGIASAFLVLQATELGLGTCFVAYLNEESVKRAVDIPEQLKIPFVVTLGYPSEIPPKGERKPLEKVMKLL